MTQVFLLEYYEVNQSWTKMMSKMDYFFLRMTSKPSSLSEWKKNTFLIFLLVVGIFSHYEWKLSMRNFWGIFEWLTVEAYILQFIDFAIVGNKCRVVLRSVLSKICLKYSCFSRKIVDYTFPPPLLVFRPCFFSINKRIWTNDGKNDVTYPEYHIFI